MFLYPTFTFFLSGKDVSRLSLSSFSEVNESPPPLSLEGVVDCGGEAERAEGEVDRVMGAFTAIESLVDAVVERDALEPVLRAYAARRGRGAEVVDPNVDDAPPFGALMLIRAASWFRDGGRPVLCFTGDSEGAAVVEVMVVEMRVTTTAKHSHLSDLMVSNLKSARLSASPYSLSVDNSIRPKV